MAFDWKTLSLNKQIILGSFGISVFSLFLPWVDIQLITLNGFQQQGYLFLICFIYPLYCILSTKNHNALVSLTLGVLTVILTIWFINSKSVEIYEGESVNVSGSGLWLFALCTFAFTFACFKELNED
tara:strand:- start:9965 stop:10345 length:381 start_codon:yes stop_codon:yes gene_type:complete